MGSNWLIASSGNAAGQWVAGGSGGVSAAADLIGNNAAAAVPATAVRAATPMLRRRVGWGEVDVVWVVVWVAMEAASTCARWGRYTHSGVFPFPQPGLTLVGIGMRR